MAINDLRTKITDLPLCEDIDSLETVVGVGADGKMYRVDKNSIAGGGKWIPLSGTVSASGEISVNNDVMLNAISTGGKIHVIAYNGAIDSTSDLSFLIAEPYINNSPAVEASTYDLSSPPITGSTYFFGNITLFVGLLYNGTNYSIGLSSPTNSSAVQDFEVMGLFFEPIKNIGDLRITGGSGGGGGSTPM